MRIVKYLFIVSFYFFIGTSGAQNTANPFELRASGSETVANKHQPKPIAEQEIDHSNPFEIIHVPANYALRDTLLVKKPIPITSKKSKPKLSFCFNIPTFIVSDHSGSDEQGLTGQYLPGYI
ncbi:MAG: hypothetical protein IPL13_09790 [Saprospiraceae bacterium]|nr:hypothetical protein [Candidatus Brachybacter algidus]